MNPSENSSPAAVPVAPAAPEPSSPAPVYRRSGAFFISDLNEALSQVETCAEGHDPEQFYPALIKMLKEKLP